MEIKKNPKADLNTRRGLFLQIGLVLALALVVGAFAYSQKEKVVEKLDLGFTAAEADMTEITRPEEPKPIEPAKQSINVISDILNVVKNDTKISTDFDFAEFEEDKVVVQTVNVEEETIEEDAPFLFAEEMPKFKGGDLGVFRNWVMSQVKYPTIAQENGIDGTVVLQFVIERDGRLTNIVVLQTPDQILSNEAIRVLQLSPKWSPGKQRNMPVRVKYTLPVVFTITN